MRGIPGKEREEQKYHCTWTGACAGKRLPEVCDRKMCDSWQPIPEPTCPECGHKVSEHSDWVGFGCDVRMPNKKLCPCRLTPADLPPKEKPVEKHCSKYADPEKDCPELQCCIFACHRCEWLKPVEPTEKQYVVLVNDYELQTLEDAREYAKECALACDEPRLIVKLISTVTPTKDVEWHEEQ